MMSRMRPGRVIAVIPARGGSRGIPRKNVRFLAGKPLIHYAIETALRSKFIDEVVVSTDSNEIQYISGIAGAHVVSRPKSLAEDHITLDPVIDHALKDFESIHAQRFDLVVTLQPTCPLLSTATLDAAFGYFFDHSERVSTLISVIDDRHLSWTTHQDQVIPTYTIRANRPQLPPHYRETGAFLITRRDVITPRSQLGAEVSIFEIPRDEAIEIDHPTDWWVAEKLLKRQRILIRVDGYEEIGLGHISRTLLLAHRLIDHQLLFVSDQRFKLGAQMIAERNFPVQTFEGISNYERIIESYQPHIVINDILDTSPEQVRLTTLRNIFTVNFEDLGEGALESHLVINALYGESHSRSHTYGSHRYFCLRDEFLLLSPRAVSPTVEHILITFGGTDPNNFTCRVIALLERYERPLQITVILGRGYHHQAALSRELKREVPSRHHFELLEDVDHISHYMHRADLIFTSAGRTVYEVASLGTPLIVLAQNERELLHSFARVEHGVINLGLGAECTDEEILEVFTQLTQSPERRAQLQTQLLAHDLRGGVDRTIELILESAAQWSRSQSLLLT